MTNAISVKDRLKKQAVKDGRTMQFRYGSTESLYIFNLFRDSREV